MMLKTKSLDNFIGLIRSDSTRLNPTDTNWPIILEFQSGKIIRVITAQHPIRCDHSYDPAQLDPTGQTRSVESDRAL